jgi:choline dehydrogenase-like flavoprotein
MPISTEASHSMHRDALTIRDDEVLEADICIIGAGPAGITIAHELAGSDVHVILLESGGRILERESSDDVHARSIGYSYFRQKDARARGFGGSSLIWPLEEGLNARPLDPIDFEARQGAFTGWPLRADDLADYYRRADMLTGLGDGDYDRSSWVEPEEVLPLDPSVASTTLMKIAYHFNFAHFWKDLAPHRNIDVITHATAVEIVDHASSDLASHVRVANGIGGHFSVAARVFVLAAGGIDNARLLLLSRGRRPAGLGNAHDLVGRFFMDRISTRTGYIEPTADGDRPCHSFYVPHLQHGQWVQGLVRLTDDVIRREGLANCLFFILPRAQDFVSEGVRSAGTLVKGVGRSPAPPQVLGHVRNVVRHSPALARLAVRTATRRQGSTDVLVLRAQGEQTPNPASRVRLSDRTDRFGTRRAVIEWRPHDDDLASVRRSQDLLDAALQRAGIGRLRLRLGEEAPPALIEGNRHHVGTTRMADSPRQGPVNGDGRLHEAANVYVAGSSVFPTSGASNPTLTIIALAIRMADHLKARIAAGAPRPAGERMET